MSTIRVEDETKDRFTDLQPDEQTQAEFVETLLDAYEQSGPGVDPEEWADRVANAIAGDVATQVEIGAYRGAKDALETRE